MIPTEINTDYSKLFVYNICFRNNIKLYNLNFNYNE